MRDETHGPVAGPGQSCRERAVTEGVTDARSGTTGPAAAAIDPAAGCDSSRPFPAPDVVATAGQSASSDQAPPCAASTSPDLAPPVFANHAPYYAAAHASAVYAAIDLGTNNCRLLVARPTARSFRVVDAFSRIVRLGEGLTATGRLCDEAMSRAVAALEVCAAKMDLRGVTRARIVATEACRAADNGAEFCARVEERTGLQLEVVDRRTEAGLAATGCAPLVDPSCDGAVLFDIGGGSTEVVWLGRRSAGDDGPPRARIRSWVSLPVGVVSLSERHGGVRVSPDVFHAMVNEVCGMLDGVRQSWGVRAPGRLHLLGTSGTVTTVAGIHLGLDRYDRTRVDGAWLGASHIEEVVERLMCMSFEERVANPCIGAQRADLVLAGCAIMEAVRRVFPADRLRVADRGLREGMLVQLMRADGAWRRNRPAGTPSGDARA
ncbi:Ppx/GppA phosphatase family protein [Xanthobacter autotrophicus]|uniref:Ppx/GppA phosphatase family protein n=1 Tax=Xanthobacter autotrophicus TaxID=280 RepID=UPI003727442D